MRHCLIHRISTLSALILCVVAGHAVADEEGTIKYRQGVMKAQAGYMSAMGMVVQGRADFAGNMADHAEGLHRLVKIVPALFPEGSDFGETDALDKIWQNRDGFRSKAAEAEKAASGLVAATQSGDPGKIGQAYKAVGQSCKECHEEYRRKKN